MGFLSCAVSFCFSSIPNLHSLPSRAKQMCQFWCQMENVGPRGKYKWKKHLLGEVKRNFLRFSSLVICLHLACTFFLLFQSFSLESNWIICSVFTVVLLKYSDLLLLFPFFPFWIYSSFKMLSLQGLWSFTTLVFSKRMHTEELMGKCSCCY